MNTRIQKEPKYKKRSTSNLSHPPTSLYKLSALPTEKPDNIAGGSAKSIDFQAFVVVDVAAAVVSAVGWCR